MANAYVAHTAAAIALISLLIGDPVHAGEAHAQAGTQSWAQLSPEQQKILAPLEQEWDRLEPDRRKRWLDLAARYPNLPAERQMRIQQRMHEWASLTPEQRVQARERYKQLRKLPPEKRHQLHQRWQEYQRLPEEKRQSLREQRVPEPVRALASPSTFHSALAPPTRITSWSTRRWRCRS